MYSVFSAFIFQILELEVGALQQEIERLTSAKRSLEESSQNQLKELQRLPALEEKVKGLEDALKEAEQRTTELKLVNSRLEKELTEMKASNHEEIVKALRSEIKKLLREKEVWEGQDREKANRIESLEAENEKLRKALADSERMRTELRVQLDEATSRASASGGDRRNFEEFVQVKRQLALVKAENEELKARLKSRYSVSGAGMREPHITAIERGSLLSDRRSSSGSVSKFHPTYTPHR